jgi:adenylate cyclase
MNTRYHGVFWLSVGIAVTLATHIMGIAMSGVTVDLMRGTTDFANVVLEHDRTYYPLFRAITFPGTTLAMLAYAWPLVRHSLAGYPAPVPPLVQRRTLGLPLVVALLSFGAWIGGIVFFVSLTLHRFGRWGPELVSQHVFSPLVAGFLASTTSYLLLEGIVRARIVPRVFPDGRIRIGPSALTLGVGARLAILIVAVAFTPLFTMLGLIMAAEDRVLTGHAIDQVLMTVVSASRDTFAFYLALGAGLTLLVAHSLTRPLRLMADALKGVQGGDLRTQVEVRSADEVGVLAEGVNSMVAALREREHILQTFGRVVEPSIRDYLLSGDLRPAGERRHVSVLFADLRNFTSLAENAVPEDVVATLNDFFSVMTRRVRHCGGFVDKFIGDAMLAVFGLFDASPDRHQERSAAAALAAAVGIREQLHQMNGERAAGGLPPLAVSIGIHTGSVLAATIGAAERHEYTVIGDTVNVAARLQQLCKTHGHDVLASVESYELARAAGFAGVARPSEAVTLRGRSGQVRVVALV